jgi:hypothetical protein
MQLELTYQMSWLRLARLDRSIAFRASPTLHLLIVLLMVWMIATLVSVGFLADALDRWMLNFGIPYGTMLYSISWLPGFLLVRWLARNVIKRRLGVDFNQTVRLTKDDGGLRFVTDAIEYYLKWQGISQMLMQSDGVLVSHGDLFWLVPDAAFPDKGTRLAFIREVYGHLTDEARSISENSIRPMLDSGA